MGMATMGMQARSDEPGLAQATAILNKAKNHVYFLRISCGKKWA